MGCRAKKGKRPVTFKQASKLFKATKDAIPLQVEETRNEVGLVAVQRVKERWPVDSGLSQRSWEWNSATGIENWIRYVPYVWARKGTPDKKGRRGYAFRLVPAVLRELVPMFGEGLKKRIGAG